MALVRDDRFVCDDHCASALVETLFRQATLTLIDEPRDPRRSARVRAFAQFVRLYRRHVRRMAADDADAGWIEDPAPMARGAASVACAVRALPLELRETLLLVALAGLTHCEAAEALDIPLSAVIHRLGRARARLEAHLGAGRDPSLKETVWPSAAHLRIVK